MEIIETVKTFGFEEPQMMLLTIPAVLVLYFYLFKDAGKSRKGRKRNYLIIRSLIFFLIFAAISSPFVVVKESTEESAITILLDRSASMNLYENFDSGIYKLYENLKRDNEFVGISNFSEGERTAIGDALYLGSLNPVKNNIIILGTDGESNYGKDMKKTGTNIDSIIFSIAPENPKSDISVSVACDNYALIGIEQKINVVVKKTGSENINYNLNLKVGSSVFTKEISQTKAVEVIPFNYTFKEEKTYNVAAEVIPHGSDFFQVNNRFAKDINAVLGPEILFVSNSKYGPLSEILNAYRIKTANTIRDQDLNDYDAVVLNNIPAGDLKNNYKIFREFVENGGGLMVVGGNNSYERGNYNNSNFEKILEFH